MALPSDGKLFLRGAGAKRIIGSQVSGTGITLTAPLHREHGDEAQVTGSIATPGTPNHCQAIPTKDAEGTVQVDPDPGNPSIEDG